MSYGYIGLEVPCALCNSTDYQVISKLDRHGQPLVTVMCDDCGLVYTQPMPTESEVAQFYGVEYRRNYKKAVKPPLKHTYRTGQRCLARFERIRPYLKSDMDLLDLGSGGGEFVYLLQSKNISAFGIEPNDGYGEFARTVLKVPVLRGTFEQVNVSAQSVDIVTAHHVMEHLISPQFAFSTIAGWLRPGGILNAEVPNIEATYHAPGRKFHFAHVYNYSPTTFVAMAAKSGLGCIDLELQPGTRHINAIFKKDAAPNVKTDLPSAAEKTRSVLEGHTSATHWMSGMAIRRGYGNIVRPLHEKRALRKMDQPRKVLDLIYADIEL